MNAYVYILTNNTHKIFYTGSTRKLKRRTQDHKLNKVFFTKKYRVKKLVYHRKFNNYKEARRTEFLIKKYRREVKIKLINQQNKEWKDLSCSLG